MKKPHLSELIAFIYCILIFKISSTTKILRLGSKQHNQIAGKLSNEGFVAKAPAVEGEKVKLAEFTDQLVKIKANMDQIAAL